MKRASQSLCAFALTMVLSLGMACGRRHDDGKISYEIQSKFSQDSGLSGKQLTVDAKDGVVTLSGTVDNSAQREAAGRQAAAVAGVTTVVNNLQVGTQEPPPMTASSSEPTKPSPAMPAEPSPEPSTKAEPAKKTGKSRRSSKPSQASASNDGNSSSDSMASMASMASTTPPPPAAENSGDKSSSAATQPPPPPPPPAPKKLIIDQGTQVTVRLIDPIDSEKNQTGDTFRATLDAPLTSDGEDALPSGIELTGHLVEVKSAGKFAGQSEVVLQLDSIAAGGKTYNIQTDQYKKTGSSRGKNTAEKVGGGAILGGIIGAIAGGGKGAAIGSAAGAGVGGGVQAATKSQQIKLPSETVLNFTLQAPVTVVQLKKADGNRPKLTDSQ